MTPTSEAIKEFVELLRLPFAQGTAARTAWWVEHASTREGLAYGLLWLSSYTVDIVSRLAGNPPSRPHVHLHVTSGMSRGSALTRRIMNATANRDIVMQGSLIGIVLDSVEGKYGRDGEDVARQVRDEFELMAVNGMVALGWSQR